MPDKNSDWLWNNIPFFLKKNNLGANIWRLIPRSIFIISFLHRYVWIIIELYPSRREVGGCKCYLKFMRKTRARNIFFFFNLEKITSASQDLNMSTRVLNRNNAIYVPWSLKRYAKSSASIRLYSVLNRVKRTKSEPNWA